MGSFHQKFDFRTSAQVRLHDSILKTDLKYSGKPAGTSREAPTQESSRDTPNVEKPIFLSTFLRQSPMRSAFFPSAGDPHLENQVESAPEPAGPGPAWRSPPRRRLARSSACATSGKRRERSERSERSAGGGRRSGGFGTQLFSGAEL